MGVARARIQSIQTEGERILEDRDFWRYQSRSLAVFLDGELWPRPSGCRTG